MEGASERSFLKDGRGGAWTAQAGRMAWGDNVERRLGGLPVDSGDQPQLQMDTWGFRAWLREADLGSGWRRFTIIAENENSPERCLKESARWC